jgi:isoleucyl-tRNA synthetase
MSDIPEKTSESGRDYRSSLFLPAADFPMKAGLPEAEPKWLARWAQIDLYGKLRQKARGKKLFILHDCPIYANGDIHSGTGLNHILKDFVVRSQGMLGMDAVCRSNGRWKNNFAPRAGPRTKSQRMYCGGNVASSPRTG